MTIELQMLAASIGLGFIYLFLAAYMSTRQRGTTWNLGNREGPVAPLTGKAFRLEEAFHNFRETFPFFAAAVLAVQASQRWSLLTALGVHLYFWGRLIYLVVYMYGIVGLRTAVWILATLGIVMLLLALILPFNAGT